MVGRSKDGLVVEDGHFWSSAIILWGVFEELEELGFKDLCFVLDCGKEFIVFDVFQAFDGGTEFNGEVLTEGSRSELIDGVDLLSI